MNNRPAVLFKGATAVRLVCIPLYFILQKLWHNAIPDYGFLKGIKIELPLWQYLLAYGTIAIFFMNTITGFVLSYMPGKVPAIILEKKKLVAFFSNCRDHHSARSYLCKLCTGKICFLSAGAGFGW